MSTAACRNKGFILDGYPRNQNDAKHIFLNKIENYQPPVDSNEADESKYPGYEVDESILPQYVIVISGDDAYLK